MTVQRSSLGHQVGEKVVRTAIAIVGLLVLRVVLSALPVLNHAGPLYPDVWADPWRAAATASPDAQKLQVMEQQWRDAFGDRYDDLIKQFQDYVIQTGMRPNQRTDPAAALKLYQNWLISAHLAIFPITIARAVVDTLILVLLVFFGLELRNLYRSSYPRFPDLGQILNLCVLTIVAAIAYVSYQGIAYPLIGADGQQAYDWIFLLIGLAPLIGLVVMAARNMDSLTSLIMRSGTGSATAVVGSIACGSCGHPMQLGTKFCPNCGAGSAASAASPSARNCSSCGAENQAAAKFCKECG
ncbi:MAG: zinc ribbon domain-containing protein, partial [Candidatus Acidiferrales bacterium]